jgi:hypothetical protein
MKTNIFSSQKASLYSLRFFERLITSCGSYQNSSYYGDGIYGDQGNPTQRRTTENSNNRYSDYFSSLQNDNQSTEIFTDIDQYNDYQGTNDNNQGIDVVWWLG